MARYRIRVESIDGSEDMDENYVDGIECNGFAILADRDGAGKSITAIQGVNLITLAAMMLSTKPFRAAHKLMEFTEQMDSRTDVAEKKEPDEKEEFLRRVIGSLNED